MTQIPSDTSISNLLLIDDHPIVLEGIRNIIKTCPEIGEIYTAESAARGLELLRSHDIDICMVDIELPDMSGFELIEQIRLLYPGMRIIIETMHGEIWFVRRMIKADADAIILKDSEPVHLQEAIRAVREGRKYYCPHFQKCRKKLPPELPQALSKREQEVLKCISEGLKSNEIATELYISVNTVEYHRKQIMLKLDAKNASDMLIKAIKSGLLEI